MLELRIPQIQDIDIRENFKLVQDSINKNPLLADNTVIMEMEFGKAESALKIPHNLKFQPKDAILTSTIGTGVASFNFDQFDRENIVMTTTGPCKVRFILGTFGGQ